MKEAGREVINIIDQKMGAASTQPGPIPPPSTFQVHQLRLIKKILTQGYILCILIISPTFDAIRRQGQKSPPPPKFLDFLKKKIRF